MFELITRWVLKYRIIIILLAIIVTSLLAKHSMPPTDNSMDIWLESSDPAYRAYMAYQDQFESEEFIILVFHGPDIFSQQNLQVLQRLTLGLENIEGIDRVMSLTNAEELRSLSDGTLESVPLVGTEIPSDSETIKKIRDYALNSPFYIDNLISRDAETTAVYGIVSDRDIGARRRMLEKIEVMVRAEEKENHKIYLSGSPVMDAEFERMSEEDSITFTFVTSFMIVAILYILYRSLSGVFLPLLVVGLATIWTLGLYGFLGHTLNMMTIMLPAVILAISVADAIHLMCQYNDEHLERPGDKQQALIRTLGKVGVPCLFTSMTTAIGFGSFIISEIGPVRLNGVFTALGIMLAFLVTVTLLPALLCYLKPLKITHRKGEGGDWVSRWLEASIRVVDRRPKAIICIGFVVLVISLIGITKLKRETNSIEFFKKTSPFRISLEFIEKKLTGTFSLEILFEGPPDSLKDPAVLAKVEDLRDYLHAQPSITKTLHINDLLMEMNRIMHDGDEAFYTLPATRNEVAQYLLLYEMTGGETLNMLMNHDHSLARLSIRSISMPIESAKELIEALAQRLERSFNGPVQANITGIVPLWIKVDSYLLTSQTQSFFIAATGIFIMMCILMRSLRVGLLSMIPNLFPIVVTMGVMGWTGIRLDTATIMITSVALGIAVDDTIHFLARFRRELAICNDYDEALHRTIRTIGRAIFFTSIILFWGFISLTFGHFKPTIYFGFLTSLTMIVALVGDIFLLPVLLKLFRPIAVSSN